MATDGSSRVPARPRPPETLAAELDELLETLEARKSERPPQNALFEVAAGLLTTGEGLHELHARAERFDAAGVFTGGPWEDPSQLQVPLVAGTLRAPGITPVVESLSELRLLAIAEGRVESEAISRDEATQFLEEVMARNLRYLFPGSGETEESREGGDPMRESHERLFALLVERLGLGNVLHEVVTEIEQTLAQRPISTWTVRRMIDRARRLAEEEKLEGSAADVLQRYVTAARSPSPLSSEHTRLRDYRTALAGADRDTLETEARAFAESMLETGLVAAPHAILVRALRGAHPELLATALGLDDAGTVELEQNATELAHRIIDAAVFPTTAQCLYGFREALERTLLSRPEVAAGLERLLGIEILGEVEKDLLAHRAEDDPVSANAVLLAGTVAVLGQPLGIGQGRNPTCQSARGMSLWAQHDPAHLLELIVAAARDGRIELPFHGQMLRSDTLAPGVAAEIDLDLDPVSIALVPHLDRLYSELMRRSSLQMEDAHKRVNPALYGGWVPNELASAFADLAQTTVADFEAFVRCFFATHHHDFNGGHRLMYPNPVGLVITNHQGRYLGPHAVSIQRVDPDPDGVARVYFYNPNNEGRQDWGQGVTPAVYGHGEIPGESSLPFDSFAARIYAFHYNPNEEGDRAAVPAERVAAIVKAARSTWGERFFWLGAPPADQIANA
jgi:hypothetical protein